MKAKAFALAVAFLGVLITNSRAADTLSPLSRFYFITDFGANLVQNIDFDRILGVSASGTPSVAVDPGIRGTVGVGYDFIPEFGMELEGGFSYNETKTYNGAVGGVPLNGSIRMWQVPLTVGFIWKPIFAPAPRSEVEIYYGQDFFQRLLPFIGGGIGAAEVFAEFDNFPATNPVDGDGHDTVFTYYLKAGWTYPLTDRAELGIQYRFAGNPGFQIKDTKSDEIFNHSVGMVFRFRF